MCFSIGLADGGELKLAEKPLLYQLIHLVFTLLKH